MRGRISLFILKRLSMKKRINPSRRMAFGFSMLILMGTVLLMLPVSSKNGEVTPFLTAMFTAVSSTCVTGLVMVDTGAYYSFFGQAVIIFLIQAGGLGFMTVLTLAFLARGKSIGMRNRMMIAQNFGLENASGVVKLTKHVLGAAFAAEGIGAALLSVRFVPEYGLKGIWYSVFHSVSAFCNAGFDVFGTGDSLMRYANDFYVLAVISLLIIFGGLGFVVWEDFYTKRSFRRLSVYSKLVIIATAALIAAGTAGFFLFENENLLSAYFQSITCRTAGFDAMGQQKLTEQGKLLSVILMMIGGASGSTAGGIKVSAAAVTMLAAVSVLKGKKHVTVVGRTVSEENVRCALSLAAIWLFLISAAAFIISSVDGLPLLDAVYEAASAYGTVGLTCGITEKSSVLSKCILMLYMFLGRVGVMTVSISFMSQTSKNEEIRYPDISIMVG